MLQVDKSQVGHVPEGRYLKRRLILPSDKTIHLLETIVCQINDIQELETLQHDRIDVSQLIIPQIQMGELGNVHESTQRHLTNAVVAQANLLQVRQVHQLEILDCDDVVSRQIQMLEKDRAAQIWSRNRGQTVKAQIQQFQRALDFVKRLPEMN